MVQLEELSDTEPEITGDQSLLPSFQRAQQINQIFNDVQGNIPDIAFSDDEEVKRLTKDNLTTENLTIHYNSLTNHSLTTHLRQKLKEEDLVEIVHRAHYMSTYRDTGDISDSSDDNLPALEVEAVEPISDEVEEVVEEHSNGTSNGTGNGHNRDTVNSFIDSLISTLPAVKPDDTVDPHYELQGYNEDLDLDSVIDLLHHKPALNLFTDEEYDQFELDSVSSDGTVVMEELERLAGSYPATERVVDFREREREHSFSPVPMDITTSRGGPHGYLMDTTTPRVPYVPALTTPPLRPTSTDVEEPPTITLDLRRDEPVKSAPQRVNRRLIRTQESESDSDSSSDEDNWQNMRHEMKHQRTKLSMMRGGSPSPRDSVTPTPPREERKSLRELSMMAPPEGLKPIPPKTYSTISHGDSTPLDNVSSVELDDIELMETPRNQGTATSTSTGVSTGMSTMSTGMSTGMSTMSTGVSTGMSTGVTTKSQGCSTGLRPKGSESLITISYNKWMKEQEEERKKLSAPEPGKKPVLDNEVKHEIKERQKKVYKTVSDNVGVKKNINEISDNNISNQQLSNNGENQNIIANHVTVESSEPIKVQGNKSVSFAPPAPELKAKSPMKEILRKREKKASFGKQLETRRKDTSGSLVFDTEESYSHHFYDIPDKEHVSEILTLQLMIQDQGDIPALPPEYYEYQHDEVPTVSAYGLEGILTWLLSSPSSSLFSLITSRLTYINNCLTYVFLIRPVSASSTFRREVTQYLNSTTLASACPQLFKSTFLNPGDYPFSEKLSKLLLVNDSVEWFKKQPALFSHVLTVNKCNDISSTKSKTKVNMSVLESNLCEESVAEYSVTTVSGDVLRSSTGYVHLVQEVWGPLQQEVWGLLDSSNKRLFHVLSRIHDTQLEIAGLRVVYHSESEEPVLVLLISGHTVMPRWSDALGPNTDLAITTDPNSVRAVMSKLGLVNSLITNTRTREKSRSEMVKFFGYKFSESEIDTDSTTDNLACCNVNTMCSMVFERPMEPLFILISPLISPSLLGEIVTVLEENGCQLLGIRRCRLNYRKCINLGLSESQTRIFSKFNGTPLTSPSLSSTSNGSTPSEERFVFPQNFSVDASPSKPTLASTMLVVNRRNGMYHSQILIKELKQRVVDGNMSHVLSPEVNCEEQLSDPFLYFEVVQFSENNLWNVGGEFGLLPERKTFDFFMSHKDRCQLVSPRDDLEQVVFVGFTGKDIVKESGKHISSLLHYVQTLGGTVGEGETGHLELLGIKLVGKLNSFQAKEMTPYEVGDAQWKSSVQYLQTVPILAMLIRGINTFTLVKDLLEQYESKVKSTRNNKKQPLNLDRMMSETQEHAYTLASLFFFEKELFSDEIMRPKQLHLPPPRTHVNSILSREGKQHLADVPERLVYQSEGILKGMLAPPRYLATVLIADNRMIGYFGKILKRLEQEGFSLAGLYLDTKDEHEERIVMCVHAENSIWKLQRLLGPQDLKVAKQHHQFSLRASFCNTGSSESFYGSPTYTDSVGDVKHYFSRGLCCENTLDLQAEGIEHSVSDKIADHHPSKRRRTFNLGKIPSKPLLQTVCLLLPPDLLRCSQHTRLSPASQLLTHALNCGFELVGCRLVCLNSSQTHSASLLFNGTVDELWHTFIDRPALVVALQRENAVSCFHQILESGTPNHAKKVLHTFGHMMMVSQSTAQAQQQLTHFFDGLSPRCKDSITNEA